MKPLQDRRCSCNSLSLAECFMVTEVYVLGPPWYKEGLRFRRSKGRLGLQKHWDQKLVREWLPYAQSEKTPAAG